MASITLAVGDIHGCLDKLRTIVGRCQPLAHGGHVKFVFLGDYIDRGPDSRGVVEFLIQMQQRIPTQVVCLLGNHEQLALSAVDNERHQTNWLRNGGDAALRSYGATAASEIPEAHIAWLRALPKQHDDGLRFFAHAGVRPGKPLSEQSDEDLLWIREPFLSDDRDYGRLIVHGHSPVIAPDLRRNRLNIDTGAVFGGQLTAAVFTDGTTNPRGFLIA